MSIFTFFSHIETIRACVHPMVTTGFYMGLGRNTPWLSHTLTLMGQTHQTIKTPSAWTILGLALATFYCLNLFTLKSLSLDTILGSVILLCALAENLYTAATTACPQKKANAITASTFLTLVAIMAQTATFAPTLSFYLAASLFSLISLNNLYTLGCFLHSLVRPKPPTRITAATETPHQAASIYPNPGTKMRYKPSGATTKPAPLYAPKCFPLAKTAPKRKGLPPQMTPNRRG